MNIHDFYMNYFEQTSKRLSFRKLTRTDIPAWTTFFVHNDHLKYLGIDLCNPPEQLATDWIEMQFNRYETQGLGHLAVITKDAQEFIGVGDIIPRELEGRTELEIAYSLIPRYWGQGYGTELAQQMKAFGFKQLKADRLVSIIDKNNLRSISVAHKNEMQVLFETEYLGMEVQVFGIENDSIPLKWP